MTYNILILHNDNDRSPSTRLAKAFFENGHGVFLSLSSQPPPATEDIGQGKPFDFCIYDDNADYHIFPHLNIPTFYLAIDTTIEGGLRCKRQSSYMDHIFYAQKIAEPIFDKPKTWLPNAHDSVFNNSPENNFLSRTYQVSSVGDFDSRKERNNIKQLILSYFPKSLISNSLTYKDMHSTYGESQFVINPTLGDINLRTFESCGSGAICVTHNNINNGISDLGFIDGHNCLLYDNDDEAIDKIKTLYKYPEFMKDMSMNGYNHVINNHTYANRASVITEIYEELYR